MIGEAAALAAASLWAVGAQLWGRIGSRYQVAPGALNFGKCAVGALLFGVTALATGRLVPDLSARTFGLLALSGVLGLTLGDSCFFGCMAILGPRRALLLLSTAPVFTALGGALWLDEHIGVRQLLAILIAVSGVAVVVNEQGPGAAAVGSAPLSRRTMLVGVLLGIGSGLGQAAGSLVSRAAMASGGASPLDTTLVRLPAALLAMLVFAAATGRAGPWMRSLAKPRLLGAISGAAFIGTYLGLWLAQVGIGYARSTAVAATLLATSPLFALPLGRWLSNERVTARAAAGTVVACAGLAGLFWE